jgi:hypothetical protein
MPVLMLRSAMMMLGLSKVLWLLLPVLHEGWLGMLVMQIVVVMLLRSLLRSLVKMIVVVLMMVTLLLLHWRY